MMFLHLATSHQHTLERYAQTLRSLLKSQFVLFLTIWVPISTPMTCQIHGLMMYMPPSTNEHQMPDMVTDMMNEATPSQHQLAPVHRSLANTLMLMQMVIVIVPALDLVATTLQREKLSLLDAVFPASRTITPPRPPPRCVLS